MKREQWKNFKLRNHLMLIAGVGVMLVVTACKEDASTSIISETILEETAFAENLFNGIILDVEDALPVTGVINAHLGGGGKGKFACVTRTLETPDGEDYPLVVTLVYADSCDNWDGAGIQGTIITTISGPRDEVGTEMITTFENFFVNDHQVEGSLQRTLVSETITSSMEETTITTPEGETFSRSSNRTREMISGMDTEDREDDVFQITGSSNGTTPEGMRYSKTITSPLVSSRDCQWIVSGTIESTVDDVTTITDFGDGSCDNIATTTTEGVSEEITMDYRVKRMYRHKRG